jgi:mannose-6-phosphate isomerase
LFGVDHDAGPFPLLVKFLDANDWLSVQVHPDDAEAAELEGVPLGKCESWYVIAAQPDAELIIGHRAADRDELAAMVRQGRWEELLLRRKVRAGDFVYVPSGTLHSVGPGLLICEVQQNSDTTYRVWDFERIDAATGTARELHLDKSLRVLTAPYDPATTDTAEEPVPVEGGSRQCLVRGEFFEVTRHVIDGSGYRVPLPSFELCSVVEGAGRLRVGDEEYPVAAGAHFILPAGAAQLRCSGAMSLISSHPPA